MNLSTEENSWIQFNQKKRVSTGTKIHHLFPMKSMKSPVFQQTQAIHVWYIYLHLVDFMVNVGHGWYGTFHWRFPGFSSTFLASSASKWIFWIEWHESSAICSSARSSPSSSCSNCGRCWIRGGLKKKHQQKLYQHIWTKKQQNHRHQRTPRWRKRCIPGHLSCLHHGGGWFGRWRSFIVVKCSMIAAMGV